jgi:hypothetical protein
MQFAGVDAGGALRGGGGTFGVREAGPRVRQRGAARRGEPYPAGQSFQQRSAQLPFECLDLSLSEPAGNGG